jgi:hypothetical protein
LQVVAMMCVTILGLLLIIVDIMHALINPIMRMAHLAKILQRAVEDMQVT